MKIGCFFSPTEGIFKILAYFFMFFSFYIYALPAYATDQEYQSDSLEIVRLTIEARDLLRTSAFDQAQQKVDSIYWIAQKINWEKKIGDCHFNYGMIERIRNNLDGFFYHTSLAVEIYLNEQAWNDAARTFTSLAQVHVALKNYPAAFEAFNKSLDLRKLTADSIGITNNLINIGNLCYMEGNLADASEFFFSALRYANLLGNQNLAAIALMNMGNVLLKQANYEAAKEYFTQSLGYHRASGNRREEANVLHNLGIVYFETGDFAQAKYYYTEALRLKEVLQADLTGLLKIYNNLGVIAKGEGDLEQAYQYYLQTLELARQAGDRQTEAVVLNNLGSIKINQKEPDGLPLILESLEIARALGLRKLVLSNYNNLVQHYIAIEDYRQAFDYAVQHMDLKDSIYNDETVAKIIELQTIYETEVKEKENQLLMAENLIRKQTQRFFMITSIILVVLSISLLWAFILKRKSLLQSKTLFAKESELAQLKIESFEAQNQHLNELLFAEEEIKSLQKQQLQQKSQELTSATMLIANKNEVFAKLKKLAEDIKNNGIDENGQQIREMIGEIDRQTDFESQWDQFKSHFETIHKSFFSHLLKHNPALTQTDLQLCAYIKLNMSTKEICRLLNIEYKSVNMQRYRLRKKFELDEGQTLEEFIHTLS